MESTPPSGVALSFADAVVQTVERRLAGEGEVTVDNLCRQLQGWPRQRVHAALSRLREQDRLACRFVSGRIVAVTLLDVSPDMTPSEKVALGLALEELERPKAQERILAAQNNNAAREIFPSRGERTGKVYDLVGEAVGMSGPTPAGDVRAELLAAVRDGRAGTLREARDLLAVDLLAIIEAAQRLQRAGLVSLRPTGHADVVVTLVARGDEAA